MASATTDDQDVSKFWVTRYEGPRINGHHEQQNEEGVGHSRNCLENRTRNRFKLKEIYWGHVLSVSKHEYPKVKRDQKA